MSKPSYSSLLDLKPHQGYPVLFKDDSNQLKPRKYGEMRLKEGRLIGEVSHKEGYLRKSIISEISLDSLSVENPMGNDNNPRDGVYEKAREGLVVTLVDRPESLSETSIGISIMCKNLYRKDGYVYFTIPHKEITSLDTDESKQKKKTYNQRFGVYDGQNVYYIVLTYVWKILTNSPKLLEYSKIKNMEDLKNILVRVEFREYSEDTPNEYLAWICRARNTNVTQNETSLLAMGGYFNKYLNFSKYAETMVATKTGEECYSISDVLVEDEESEYNLEGKMSLDDYFTYIALTGNSAFLHKELVKQYENNGDHTVKYSEYTSSQKSKRFKDDNLFDISCVFINKEIKNARSSTGIVQKMQASHEKNVSEFDYLYTPELVDGFLKFFDFVTFFDYSSYDNDKLLKIGISPSKQNIVSSITKKVKKYNMGKMVMKFIPIIFGALCKVVEDEATGIISVEPSIDAEVFWTKSWVKVLDMLFDCCEEGTAQGMDKWFYYTPNHKVSKRLWFRLYSYIREYSEKVESKAQKKGSI